MPACLQEQRISHDGGNSGQGSSSSDRVLRAMKQHTHDQPALTLGLDRNGCCGPATARLLFVC
jgi:hypothetical protein